jgi:putative selenium metabolism protein SsnA
MLITDATLITWGDDPRILDNHAVFIDDGVIRAIGPTETLSRQYDTARQLSAQGQLVMPGNICAHTHFYGAYARGLAIPGPAPADFPQILRRLWWGLDKALDRDTVTMSALVCLIDAIRHGTTTLIDHHASPNFIDGSLDVIAEAVDQAGLRAVLCYEVSDRDGPEKAEAAIAENVRFIAASRDQRRIGASFGLHASMTLSDETLRRCVDALPDGSGFHIHVAEHEADQEDCLAKYGQRVIPRLREHGILGQNTITAHCVHVDDEELDILRATGTWVTHQPRSNMNNAVGAMNLNAMLGREIRLGLGNDGFSNAMWDEWNAAYLLHKVVGRDPRHANGADIARIAVNNNAQLAGQFFPGQRLGEITEGAAADLIFVDYRPFTPLSAGNLPWHILFGFRSSMITTTIVDGVVLMQDRQLLTLDESRITQEALALAPALWQRYTQIVESDR